MKYKSCGRITAAVTLVSFWMSPVFGEQLRPPPGSSGGGGTRFYSECEVERLIEEMTLAAEEAIERAAAEAAKAEALASLEREAAALTEMRHWQGEYRDLKGKSMKRMLLAGCVGLLSGLVIGGTTTFILGVR
jgi:hypothetical protein